MLFILIASQNGNYFVFNTWLKLMSPVPFIFLKGYQTATNCICIFHISTGQCCSTESLSCLKSLEWLVPAFLLHWIHWIQTICGRRREQCSEVTPRGAPVPAAHPHLGRKFSGHSYRLSGKLCIIFQKWLSERKELLYIWIFKYLEKSLKYLVQSKNKEQKNLVSANF